MARRRSLLGKLVGAYLVPTLLLLGAFGYSAHYLGRRSLDQELGRRLVAIAQAASTQVGPGQFDQLGPGEEEGRTYANVRHKLLELQARTDASRIQLLDAELGLRADTQAGIPIGTRALELEVDRAEIAAALAGHAGASVLFRGRDGVWYKRGYAPVDDEAGDAIGVMAVQGSAGYFAQLERFRRFLIVYGALGAGLVILVSALVARRITRPVRELAEIAERIGRGDLALAIRAPGSRDEIALLTEAVEQMRRSLAARDERMQMMLSGIAHEVRNPLGGMELYAGLLRDELAADPDKLAQLGRIERELGHLKTVVADFLEYARRPRPELCEVDCQALLQDVRDVLGKDCAEAAVNCAVEAPGAVRAAADANQLRRVLLNLGRNAIQATPRGGRVTLLCENGAERVRIQVKDSGAGIPPEHLPNIFLPFYTTKEKGTGLGLAFVREIVRDHGGAISVSSEPGHGTTFTIELPAWPPS
ncbi:MAG TPA: HAMP domain-containing sensor histidine kinase [Polyangia bacterium]|nr:HAMP domain-containing sensor histidine kinase [Polyangia bacterium]